MNAFALSGLLTGISSLAMGLFVLSRNPSQRLNRAWFLFTSSVAVWGFGGMWIALETDKAMALLAWRVAFALGVVWIPVLFYHFVTIFCELKQKLILPFSYLVGLSFFPFILFSSSFFGDVRYVFSSFYYAAPGSPLFHVFFAWWTWLVIYAHYQTFKLYHHASGIRRNQFKYFFLAFALAYGSGSLDYLPIYGIDIYPYGNFGITLYPILMTYAIARYRLMDITVVMHKGLTYVLLLGGALIPAYLAVLVTQRATLYSIPPLLAGSLVLASGLWVILKKPQAITNRTFGLLCLGACIWLFSFFMLFSAQDGQNSLFWGKFLYIGVVYVPAFFYHFSVSFLRLSGQSRKILALYAVSTLFLMLIPTTYLINGQYSYFWGPYPKAGLLHPLFVSYFFAVGAVSLRHLYAGMALKEGSERDDTARVKFVFWAFLIGYAASVDFAQNYGIEFYPPGFLFATLWVVLVTYAIARYQLLDISIIISRTKVLPYAQGLAIILSTYLVTFLLILTFTGTKQYVLAGVLVATFLVCAELLVSLQRRMERVIGKALFRERHDAYETLIRFSHDMVTNLDLKDLSKRFLDTLSQALSIPNASLFLLDKEKDIYALASSRGRHSEEMTKLRVPIQHGLARHLAHYKSPLVREELEYHAPMVSQRPLIETLKTMGSEACIPLVNKDRLVGFCNLGPRSGKQIYSEDDLSLLTTLAQNAAIALDNATLYEDLKRSQLLMRRTDRLRSLETIAGGFAHEVRNPLTSIKTFIQLAPERKDDFEFLSEFSKVVNDDVLRIERLIEEILDYAKYMQPRLTEEDLNTLVSSCLYFVQVKAEAASIKIEQELAGNLPYVMLDRQQIKQVVLNLLLNAMDSMREAGGQITIKTHQLRREAEQDWVQIEVADTGPGIDHANLDHIFDPFYTTKHESGEHEGTGLGLTIVHQIVQEHQGNIQVESEVGRGTTFFVNLPASPRPADASRVREEHEETRSIGR